MIEEDITVFKRRGDDDEIRSDDRLEPIWIKGVEQNAEKGIEKTERLKERIEKFYFSVLSG